MRHEEEQGRGKVTTSATRSPKEDVYCTTAVQGSPPSAKMAASVASEPRRSPPSIAGDATEGARTYRQLDAPLSSQGRVGYSSADESSRLWEGRIAVRDFNFVVPPSVTVRPFPRDW